MKLLNVKMCESSRVSYQMTFLSGTEFYATGIRNREFGRFLCLLRILNCPFLVTKEYD